VYRRLLAVCGVFPILFVLLSSGSAWAAPPSLEDLQKSVEAAQVAGDTGFMLVSAALVLLMTPGLAFFYGGFVRGRNVLNTMMMSFILMGLVGTTWVIWGYSLSFAPGLPFIGSLKWLLLNGVGMETTDYLKGSLPEAIVSYAPTIPHQTFMIYQGMFAIITPALISGAIVERISFKAYFWFILLWSGILYPIFAHMVWAKGGFLGLYGGLGALDFAGGTVVHISSGVSALVAAWVIGPRKTFPNQLKPPHNVPFILLGAGLLWFGWFGFNGGSALASGGLATLAFVNTNTAAAAAALVWVILEWVLRGKPTAVGIATLLIGAITSTCCFFAINLKAKLKFDDSLDTFPVHGVGGTVGALLTGIFATKTVNSAGADGVLFGAPGQIVTQIIAIAITYVLAGAGTFIILKILDATIGLRVKTEEEFQGLDINEHGEEGYNDLAG
jgi:ammonium transporter, Amt family